MNKPLSIKKDYIIVLFIILLTAVTRIYFGEQNFGGFATDPANFTLAAQSYSIANNRPHLPGYYLHIKIIRFVQLITRNTQSAMIILSVAYSAIAMGFLYLLFCHWFDTKISILLTLLIITNPMVWFYGSVTEIYSFDLLFGILLAWLGLSPIGIYFTPLLVGLFSGIRPSSGILLVGLYSFLWYHNTKLHSFSFKKFLFSHLIGLAGFLIWFIPMINSAGGLVKYISLYSTNLPVEKPPILQNWFGLSSYFIFLLPAYVVLIIYLVYNYFLNYKIKNGSKFKSNELEFSKNYFYLMLSWCIPPIIFFFFYLYDKGYFLLCVTPFLSLAFILFHKKKTVINGLVTTIILQILIFCFLPYSKPEVQTYFSPGVRHMSIAHLWLERTGSEYLMSQSYIKAMGQATNEIDNIINALPKTFSDSMKNNYLILIDPTIPLSVRSLQVKYPNKYFCSLLLHEPDQYMVYNKLDTKIQNGLNNLFDKALVISRTDFVRQYLQKIDIQSKHYGNYSVYNATNGENEKLANIYTYYFLRTK